MSVPRVTARTLRSAGRGFAWWSLGLVSLVTVMVAVYPTVRDSAGLDELIARYPAALRSLMGFSGVVDYGSAAGYLGGELFGMMVPLLLLIAAIGGGANAIAGEEERGTLDLLLSTPLSRRRLVLEKLAAISLELAALGAILLVSLAVGARVTDMAIGLDKLLAATTMSVLLACVYAAIAVLVGAAWPGRARAIGLTSAVGIAAYLLNALAPLVPRLDGLRGLSPFYHATAGDPLRTGLAPLHVLFLVAAFVVVAVVATALVERREFTG
jgi:ABC-2 type transport system permease protein